LAYLSCGGISLIGLTKAFAASTQLWQQVHSWVQIITSAESGGRSQLQPSQFGRSFNICLSALSG
jgi:hypothetical protein